MNMGNTGACPILAYTCVCRLISTELFITHSWYFDMSALWQVILNTVANNCICDTCMQSLQLANLVILKKVDCTQNMQVQCKRKCQPCLAKSRQHDLQWIVSDLEMTFFKKGFIFMHLITFKYKTSACFKMTKKIKLALKIPCIVIAKYILYRLCFTCYEHKCKLSHIIEYKKQTYWQYVDLKILIPENVLHLPCIPTCGLKKKIQSQQKCLSSVRHLSINRHKMTRVRHIPFGRMEENEGCFYLEFLQGTQDRPGLWQHSFKRPVPSLIKGWDPDWCNPMHAGRPLPMGRSSLHVEKPRKQVSFTVDV